ncbi:MAG: 1,4-dihydroxy-6-naphthoate synthase [Trueperaceae bacterium]
MEARTLRLGYSPCPNDTFIFHALVHGLIPQPGTPQLNFDVELADVEALNLKADDGALDVAKISYHAYGYLADRYVLLPTGGALGQGVGPLVVAREPGLDLRGKRVAIPGGRTTANLLLRLWQPEDVSLVELRYDKIMPAVVAGEVDAGLIIHESRFTYPQYGLHQLVDLGAWWEGDVGELVPLGAIAARRSLGTATLTALTRLVRASLEYAWANPEASAAYVEQHAQEMEPSVRQRHIDLYVNEYSRDVGAAGASAARELLARGHHKGLFDPVTEPFFAVG